MTKSTKTRFIPILLSLLLVDAMAEPSMSMAAQQTVDPGTTSSFAIMASSTNIPWLVPICVSVIMLLLITYPVIIRRISSSKRLARM